MADEFTVRRVVCSPMKLSLSLPIADRRTSHDFYAALGFEAFGEIASDGLPEPLQFAHQRRREPDADPHAAASAG